jgi:hypothetical protein
MMHKITNENDKWVAGLLEPCATPGDGSRCVHNRCNRCKDLNVLKETVQYCDEKPCSRRKAKFWLGDGPKVITRCL